MKSRYTKPVLGIGAVLIVLLIIMPPYFGIDTESGGEIHASMGYHFIWSKPTPEQVYEQLTGKGADGVDPARLSAYQARLNAVRLAINVVSVAILVGIVVLAIRRYAADT